jgi:nucleotide-binding universal stress UspA family protein
LCDRRLIEEEQAQMKIVLAVDGSKHGRWSMGWVPHVPLVTLPKVVAVHALDLAALKAPFMMQPVVIGNQPYIRAEVTRLEQQAKRVSMETKDFLASAQLAGKVIVERSAPAPAILKHARHGDVIMLGRRGLTGLDRFLLGSVSQRITLHAHSSVFIVKQPPRVVRRILLATDGSKSSSKAIRFVMEEMRSENIEIELVHIIPFMRHPELKEAGLALLDRDASRLLKAGYTVNETLKIGQPAEEIIKIADRYKVDVIVLGAKGLGAIARFFLGSVSMQVVQHSTCSVLVVR